MPISEVEMNRRKKESEANQQRAERVLRMKARSAWSGDDASFEKAFPAILEQLRIAEVVSAVNTPHTGAHLD